MPMMQQTLVNPVSLTGKGLHTGKRSSIRIHPADAGHGIIFRRIDAKGQGIEIPASWKNTKELPLCTCIVDDNDIHVRTIEHLMAAFYACEIDNARVDVEGDEIPILDGSARPFVKALENAGITKQNLSRQVHRVPRLVEYSEGDRKIQIEPADQLIIDIHISLAKIGHLNWHGIVEPKIFKQEIIAARTFGRLRNGILAQFTRFQKDPVCLGANTSSALVIVGDKVLNKGGLRMPNEYVRHRVLDLVGDLMLSGGHIHGKITAHSTAHRLNHGLLRALFSEGG
jgi:UDP-3-O-[3-hydroxymyristoyl] N-acetylglucosamine deacetylase